MSRRDWVSVLAAVGLALTWATSGQSEGYNARGDSGAHEARPKPQDDSQPSLSFSVQNNIERIARALEAENNKQPSADEQRRAEQDLRDQDNMAKWAMWMFWIGGGELLLTASGVFLVWRTLIHTRDAAIAARDAVTEAEKATKANREVGEAQVRAYLHCADSNFIVLDSAFNCSAAFKNTGQSPASKIEIEVTITIWSEDMSQRYEAECLPSPVPPIEAGGIGTAPIMATESDLQDAPDEIFMRDDTHVSIRGVVTWQDVFGKESCIAFTLVKTEVGPIKITLTGTRYRQGAMAARNRTPMSQEEWERDESAWAAEEHDHDGQET